MRVGDSGAELGDFGGDQLDDGEDRNAEGCFGGGEPGYGHRFLLLTVIPRCDEECYWHSRRYRSKQLLGLLP
jgi:hypothetical protein